jgi:uncharacterized membrane protein HdeD (DUF308 family)
MSVTEVEIDERDALAAVGKHWGLLLTVGILTALLGLVFVFQTNGSLKFITALFGIYLLVSGIFQIVQSFSRKDHRALLAISGILSLILAVWCLKSLANSAEILALFVGFAWLFRGLTELIVGIQSKGVDGRGWLITGGILMILGSIVVFVWPAASLLVIVWITGISLIVLGISEIVGAFQIKKLAGV